MKASGFVADSLKKHGIEGAGVAPASRLPERPSDWRWIAGLIASCSRRP
jgi:hypothetical protein